MKRQPYPDDKNFALCELHFEDDYFVRDFMHELNNQKRKYKLKEDAVGARVRVRVRVLGLGVRLLGLGLGCTHEIYLF